jgi:hypothetical protein
LQQQLIEIGRATAQLVKTLPFPVRNVGRSAQAFQLISNLAGSSDFLERPLRWQADVALSGSDTGSSSNQMRPGADTRSVRGSQLVQRRFGQSGEALKLEELSFSDSNVNTGRDMAGAVVALRPPTASSYSSLIVQRVVGMNPPSPMRLKNGSDFDAPFVCTWDPTRELVRPEVLKQSLVIASSCSFLMLAIVFCALQPKTCLEIGANLPADAGTLLGGLKSAKQFFWTVLEKVNKELQTSTAETFQSNVVLQLVRTSNRMDVSVEIAKAVYNATTSSSFVQGRILAGVPGVGKTSVTPPACVSANCLA